jgi:hypothetical protein
VTVPVPTLITVRDGWLIAVAVAISLAAGLLGRRDQWVGVWTETQGHLSVALIFGVPAAAAVGAWRGAAARHSGQDLLAALASRSRPAVVWREVRETWGWTAVGYFLVAAPAYAITARTSSYGHPRCGPVLADLAVLCAAAVTGLGVGRQLPWLVAGPAAAVASYLGLGVLVVAAEDVTAALTPLDERWMTFHRIPAWVYLAQVVLWLLVAVAVVGGRMGVTGSRRTIILWMAGIVAAPLLYVSGHDRQPVLAAMQLACTPVDEESTICLPRVKQYLREEIATTLRRARGLTAGLTPRRAAYVDDEAAGQSAGDRSIEATVTAQAAAGRPPVRFSSFSDLSGYTIYRSTAFYVGYARAAFPPPAHAEASKTASTQDRPEATPTDVLTRWFFEELHIPLDGTAAPGAPFLGDAFVNFDNADPRLRWLRALTPPQRTIWFQQHRAEIAAGTLTWEAFG